MTQEFRKTQPLSHEIKSLKLIEPGHFLLDNDIPVYTVDAGTEDLMKLDLVFDAGYFYQTQALVASLTNKCLQEGTSGFTSQAIANTVDFYGAHLRHGTDKDDARLTLYCLGRHFDILLPVVAEVAFQPTFPQEEVDTIIAKSKQQYHVNMEKVKFVAQQKFGGLIFGQTHPYASSLVEGDYEKITRHQMTAFHAKHYANSPFKIVVSGKLPQGINKIINNFFGKHPIATNNLVLKVPEAIASENREHIIIKENSLQSALRIGKVLFNKHHPDYIKMKVVNTILGGYFGSRLMTNIREDKGYTYGIGSNISSLKYSGSFAIASEVGTDVREKALVEIFKEIETLRSDLVLDDELNLVKNYMLGSFLRSADGPFALSELVKSVIDYGFDMDYFNDFLSTIKNITAKEIRDLAVKYLDPTSMTTLVVGK